MGFRLSIGQFRLGPVELALPAGQVHALLGPNGSGKTTFLRACQGLLQGDSGQLMVLGSPVVGRPVAVLGRVGYVPDDPEDVIAEATAPELWELVARAHVGWSGGAGPAVAELLTRAGELSSFLDFTPPTTVIAGFSHGMRKKTQLVAALMTEPELLVLDEPRNGLDPLGILRLEELMAQAAQRGAAVLVSSHDLHWAARVADQVHILHNGRVLASGPPAELLGADADGVVSAFLRLTSRRDGEQPVEQEHP